MNDALTPDARRALDYLAEMPAGVVTLLVRDAKSLMRFTDGWMLAGGYAYDIRRTSIGFGLYRLTLTSRRSTP